MMDPRFLIVVGLILVGLGLLEFAKAMKTGRIKMRGGAHITRERRPGIFWINVGFDIDVACGGAALALWSYTHG